MTSTEKISFEQLPQAVSDLKEEVSGLKDLINTLIHRTPAENADQWMNIDQLRAYHPDRPARSTIYDWVCQNRIPVHKDGKKLRFLRSEIDQWLSGGRIKTKDEIEAPSGSSTVYRPNCCAAKSSASTTSLTSRYPD